MKYIPTTTGVFRIPSHDALTSRTPSCLAETNSSNLNPNGNSNAIVDSEKATVLMGQQLRSIAKASHRGEFVQSNDCTRLRTSSLTQDQVTALKQLRRVPAPFTTSAVVEALGWSKDKAERVLACFRAKGLLDVMPNRRGHVWRAA